MNLAATLAPSTALVSVTAFLSVRAGATEQYWQPSTTATLPGEVSASDERGPAGGDYGRFDGDVTLSAGAGVELASDPTRGLVGLSAHYYAMAGPYLTLRPPLAEAEGDDDLWFGSLGIDLSPVFIPRWAMDLERGPAFLDLILDSLSITAGAFVGLGSTRAPSRPAGFEAGLGAGVPLLATARGPWLEARYVLGWRHAGAPDPSVWLSLSWHLMLDTPLRSQTGNLDQ